MQHYINRAALKKRILDRAEKLRPGWTCTRVSKEALDDIEAHVLARLDALIRTHPNLGKTFRP